MGLRKYEEIVIYRKLLANFITLKRLWHTLKNKNRIVFIQIGINHSRIHESFLILNKSEQKCQMKKTYIDHSSQQTKQSIENNNAVMTI